MGAMVLSSGRSGTNLLLAMLSSHEFFTPLGPNPEDKQCWFTQNPKVPVSYLSKSDTHYIINFDSLSYFLNTNPHVKILWTLRDPRDWAMSKVRRGIERDSYDSTFEGCVADMYHMFRLYKQLGQYAPDRIKTVKMEYLINNPTKELKEVCEFLNINYTEDMLDFRHNIKKKKLKDRYKVLDTSQIGLYKKWQKAYDGFLTQIPFNMEDLFAFLNPLTLYFKYEV
jgi:hypothetical protein